MGPKTGKRRGQRKLWAVTITVYVRHRSGSAAEDHVQSHLDPSPDGCSLIEGTNAPKVRGVTRLEMARGVG